MNAGFSTLQDKATYGLKDLTSVGRQSPFSFSFMTDEQVYKMSPRRYAFYIQMLDALQDPKSELLDRVLSIENKFRFSADELRNNIRDMSKSLKYLGLQQQTGGQNEGIIIGGTTDSELKQKVISIFDIYTQPLSETDIPSVKDFFNNNNMYNLDDNTVDVIKLTEFNTDDTTDIPESVLNLKNVAKFVAHVFEIIINYLKIDKKDINETLTNKSLVQFIVKNLYNERNTKFSHDSLYKKLVYVKTDDNPELDLLNRFLRKYAEDHLLSAAAAALLTGETSGMNTTANALSHLANEELQKSPAASPASLTPPAVSENKNTYFAKTKINGNLVNRLNLMLEASMGSSKQRFEFKETTGGQGASTQEGGADSDSFFKQKLDKIIENKENFEETRKIAEEVETHPVYGSDVSDISTTDRVVFIAIAFVIRGLTLFLIDWAIKSQFITSFNNAFLYYILVYCGIFMIWVIITNTGELNENLGLKLMFNYINVKMHGFGRIVVHLLLQLMLLPIPFIVKEPVQSGDTENVMAENFQRSRAMYRLLSNFTLFVWIFTSVIALRY